MSVAMGVSTGAGDVSMGVVGVTMGVTMGVL